MDIEILGLKEKWHLRFLELAKQVSTWSKDSTKVGAVIVDPSTKKVVSMGYNGFPRGVADTIDRYEDGDTKLKLVAHAEVNAIINAEQSVRGCLIYVYPTLMNPNSCPDCSKAIVQSGIKAVVGYQNDNISQRWQELAKYSSILLQEGGVAYLTFKGE